MMLIKKLFLISIVFIFPLMASDVIDDSEENPKKNSKHKPVEEWECVFRLRKDTVVIHTPTSVKHTYNKQTIQGPEGIKLDQNNSFSKKTVTLPVQCSQKDFIKKLKETGLW